MKRQDTYCNKFKKRLHQSSALYIHLYLITGNMHWGTVIDILSYYYIACLSTIVDIMVTML